MYMPAVTLAWLVGVHDRLARCRTGIAGWVYRVGNTREYPAAKDVHPQGHIPAKRAPEALAGLEWVGI